VRANDRSVTPRRSSPLQLATLHRPGIPQSSARISRRAVKQLRRRDTGSVRASRCRPQWQRLPGLLLNLVDEAGILAISIEFREVSFPEHLWYHFGNLRYKDGTPNRREEWTSGIDERLFDQLRARRVTTRQHYGLFGHSRAGSLYTEWSHSDSAITSPSPSVPMQARMRCRNLTTPWPFGLGGTDVDTDALRGLLGFCITVMAGTADVSTIGRFFPKGSRSMRQSATRYARAHNYVRSGHAATAVLQTSCPWTVIDVPEWR
jgi:hypothetical protein